MLYQVRWTLLDDDRQHCSSHHLSTRDATDFACALLDRTAISDIWIVDSSGQNVIRMPEIARCRRLRDER